MAFPDINTIEELLFVIDQYFTSPRRPPLKGEEANFILKKLLTLTTKYTDEEIAALKGDVPEMFDTLEEISDALKELKDQLSYDEQHVQSSVKLVKSGGIWAYVKSQVDTVKAFLVTHPTYNNPVANLSSGQSANSYEVGQTVNIALSLTFTKNDAGNATGCTIKRAGSIIASNNNSSLSYTDSGIVLSTTPVNYQGIVSYGIGPIKKDKYPDGTDGDEYPTGRIQAGDATTSTSAVSIRGYYATWYGVAEGAPANSADVRALQTYNSAGSLVSGKQLTNQSNSFTHRTGSVNKVHVIITAPGKSLSKVEDQDALNKDITDEYIYQGTMAVNDAAGNPVSGFKIYMKTMGVAYTSSHRHNITLA